MQLVNQSSNPQEQIIDLKVYWTIVMKSKWKIVGFAFFTTLLVAIFVAGLTPIYRSTASLLIKANTENTVSIDTVYSLDTSRKEYFLTQFEILKSRAVAEQVIDKLDLAYHKEFMSDGKVGLLSQLKSTIKSFLPIEDVRTHEEDVFDARRAKVQLIGAFQKRLIISPIRKTQLVNISFEATDPRLAALVANTVAEIYITQEMSGQLNSTKKAADWLRNRLDELRFNLEASITDLQAYRIKENLIDIKSKGVRSIASDELESLTESYLKAKKARFEAETIYLFVSKVEGNDIDSLMSLPEISNHPLIKEIKRVEIEAQKNLSEMSFRYGKKHPKLIAARAQLTGVKQQLTLQANKLVKGIAKGLKAAKDNERRFAQELRKEKQKFQTVTNKEQGYLKLKREVDANRNLYETFLTRYKEMAITTDLEVQQARIIDAAEIPLIPAKPNKKLLVILAFVASFGFAVVLTFVLDALNDSFRTAQEVESKLGMRLLGLLPLIKLKRKQQLPMHAYFDSKNKGFAEAIRTLRTGFVLSHLDNDHKVVVVTSSIPGEGKTTTSLNIAFAMAQMEKTLLIEADMRRPSFTRILNLPPYQAGLSNLISGTEKLDDLIIRDDKSGLDVLPAGFIPPNPLELLSNSKFDALMLVLKDKYDRIIIDSPPTQAVSDALVLAKQADSVIYVVRSESTKQAVVKKGLSRLLEIDAKIDGIVLNRVNIKKGGKEGYQGYYDYYGYGQENQPESKPS
ncbi:GumC family protein [Psychromonas sp. Urea-02u-13]|uniref:GumC family protein n=1 Tax=Psychromonas sp. Urea-02u-13 TaxID=2058326 RepID=UPI000C34F7D0|nr:polysaccharide biosynthesis tyrosine autokinase [Psychromonas sp. Urea-02u-13]PKG37345.1 chain-length determining protein [Psychromonas sp. Urea-02u-13]